MQALAGTKALLTFKKEISVVIYHWCLQQASEEYTYFKMFFFLGGGGNHVTLASFAKNNDQAKFLKHTIRLPKWE